MISTSALAGCGKTRRTRKRAPRALKRELILKELTARLKVVPSRRPCELEFFRSLLVLLCYKKGAPQKGQPESCRSRIRAMVCRSVAMDQGLCRSARTGRTPRVESRRHFGDG